MNEIQGIARLMIHVGKLEEFKRLAAKCMERARTRERGTLRYDWFFSADHSECVVYERYRDSDALLEQPSDDLVRSVVPQIKQTHQHFLTGRHLTRASVSFMKTTFALRTVL